MPLESIAIFTDGSSRGNPGPGGYAAIIVFSKNNDSGAQTNVDLTQKDAEKGNNYWVHEIGGREEHTTNNRMELRAAIEALSSLPLSKVNGQMSIVLYADSAYLINGITKWIHGWQKNGWKTKAKKEVENKDLWESLYWLTNGKQIEWKLISGHVGVAGNMRCDKIATAHADGARISLYSGPLANYPIKDILDINHDVGAAKEKSSNRAHSRAKAYSYISAIGGVVQVHKNWEECERRVKGKRGTIYKKAFSSEEERSLIAEFSKLSH